MDHSYFTDKLSAYFDGALDPQEMELLRRHLEECSECRQLLEKLSSLSLKITELSGLGNDEYFEELALRTEQKIAQLDEKVTVITPSRRPSLWWKVGTAAASVLLVSTVTYYQWFSEGEVPAELLQRSAGPPPEQTLEGDVGAQFEEGATEQLSPDLVPTEERSNAKQTPLEKKANESVSTPAGADENFEAEADKFAAGRKDLPAKSEVQKLKSADVRIPVVDSAKGALGYYSPGERKAENLVLMDALTDRELTDADDDKVVDSGFMLTQWRQQRDSLQLLVNLVQSESAKPSAEVRARKAALAKDVEESRVDSLTYKTDSALAQAWLQIGQFTTSEIERQQAIDFLKDYLVRYQSDSVLVQSYLEQLKK